MLLTEHFVVIGITSNRYYKAFYKIVIFFYLSFMYKEAEKIELICQSPSPKLSILQILPNRTYLKSASSEFINVIFAWTAKASADTVQLAQCLCRAAITHSTALASFLLKPSVLPFLPAHPPPQKNKTQGCPCC